MSQEVRNDDDLVWYVAYGSNLLRERFLAYLTGGQGPGPSGLHDGARDQTPPRADRAMTIERQLIFAGQSRRWNGGGVCAVVPSASTGDSPAACRGRGWLITAGQLADVWRQENGGRDPGVIEWGEFVENGCYDVEEGRYRRLDWLGRVEGIPALTITGDEEMLAELNEPNVDYLRVVAMGLTESWGLDSLEVVDYLIASGAVQPGNRRALSTALA